MNANIGTILFLPDSHEHCRNPIFLDEKWRLTEAKQHRRNVAEAAEKGTFALHRSSWLPRRQLAMPNDASVRSLTARDV